MTIIRKPLKADTPGKCSRWWVVLYNPTRHRQEWVTVRGTRRDAEGIESQFKEKLARGTFVARSERMALDAVVAAFMKECKARNRRTSTLLNYGSVFNGYVLPQFGFREVSTLTKKELRSWFGSLLQGGASVALVNRIIRALKAALFFAMTELEVLDRNILMRFKQYERSDGSADRQVRRGAFSEAEVQALLDKARPHERALIGLLCFTGMRPGEAYALRWQDMDLDAGAATIQRTWDWRGKRFTPPKTDAGVRTVPLSGWVVEQLRKHHDRTFPKPEHLIFATRTGRPMNPSNVRRDIWTKLVKRAGVRSLDLYSLRHTFATLGRVAGESAFNVARMMGHSRSTLVDQIYAHSLQSGMSSVAERVTARALGEQPKLRLINGVARDVRKPLEKQQAKPRRGLQVLDG
jgi:integrase